MKSARDMNDMITVLFETLAEDRIKHQEQSAKILADKSDIAALAGCIDVFLKKFHYGGRV